MNCKTYSHRGSKTLFNSKGARSVPVVTSPDSYWCWNAPGIKINASKKKIEESILANQWSYNDISSEFKSTKPFKFKNDLHKRFHMTPELILGCIYRSEDLNCIEVGKKFRVRENIFLGEEINSSTFIIPNPNRVKEGYTKSGKLSCCARDAIGKRMFLIVELNNPLVDETNEASIINTLRNEEKGFLKMIVRTAGKPVQAWFKAFKSENKNWKFMEKACAMGANSDFFKPEKAARVPNGLCERKLTIQECIYFDYK